MQSSDTKRFVELHKSALLNMSNYIEQVTQNPESPIAILVAQVQGLDTIGVHQYLRNNPHLIKELNDAGEAVLVSACIHHEDECKQHNLTGLLELNKEEILRDREKVILEHLQNKYASIMQGISTILEQATAICMEEVHANLDDNLKEKPDEYSTLEQCRLKHEEFKSRFTRAIGEKLGLTCDFLAGSFIMKASESIKMAILKRYATNYLEGNLLVADIAGDQLNCYMEELLMIKSFKMSDYSLLYGEKTLMLLSIMRLISYEQFQENEPSRILHLFDKVIDFLTPRDSQKILQELTQLKSKANKSELLKKEIQSWNEKSQLNDRLFAASLLFVGFIKVEKHYSSRIRHVLTSLFRNIFSNKDKFLPSQILAYLESIQTGNLEEEEKENEEESRQVQRHTSKTELKEIHKQIRNTHINSMNEHITHINQLSGFDYIFSTYGIQRAEKAILEKLSNPKTESKNIIICVSGFTSEDTIKFGEWPAVVKAYPDTEVLGLIWKSSTITSLLPDSMKDAPANPWSIIPALIGVLKADFFSNLISLISTNNKICGTWAETYQQAILTGKNLAYYLAETRLFEGHTISLVGFSLGTLVIMTCIWELEKMRRSDIIYDVLVMGGVAHIDDFYDRPLASVSHRITNCYCTTDYILMGPLKYVNPEVNPIGLGPIFKSTNKVKNIDVTSIANGHLSYRTKLEEILLKADLHQDLDAAFL